jgi:hypothetical protein
MATEIDEVGIYEVAATLKDLSLEPHRIEMQEKHTQGLRPGWYVTTAFFWHDACSIVAGPFSTQDDAMTCRTALESSEGHNQYFIDAAEVAAAGLGG